MEISLSFTFLTVSLLNEIGGPWAANVLPARPDLVGTPGLNHTAIITYLVKAFLSF